MAAAAPHAKLDAILDEEDAGMQVDEGTGAEDAQLYGAFDSVKGESDAAQRSHRPCSQNRTPRAPSLTTTPSKQHQQPSTSRARAPRTPPRTPSRA